MRTRAAFVAGVAGGAVMSIVMVIARALGMSASLEMMLGTLLLPPGTLAWIVGLAMHLLISGGIGLVYAWVFEHVTRRAGVRMGLALSTLHTMIGGLFLGILPAVHRLMPEQMAPPGELFVRDGWPGVVAFVVSHALYGAIVGARCEPAVGWEPQRITVTRMRFGT